MHNVLAKKRSGTAFPPYRRGTVAAMCTPRVRGSTLAHFAIHVSVVEQHLSLVAILGDELPTNNEASPAYVTILTIELEPKKWSGQNTNEVSYGQNE